MLIFLCIHMFKLIKCKIWYEIYGQILYLSKEKTIINELKSQNPCLFILRFRVIEILKIIIKTHYYTKTTCYEYLKINIFFLVNHSFLLIRFQ